jgi:hypothetical protein
MADPVFDPNAPYEESAPATGPALQRTPEGYPYYQAPTKLQSFGEGVGQGATFNFGDELSAAKSVGEAAVPMPESVKRASKFMPPWLDALNTLIGGGRLAYENLGEHVGLDPGIEGRKKYDEALEERRNELLAAKEENPMSYMGGELAGSMIPTAGPIGNIARGATWGERAIKGAGLGATTGALYGLGEGETPAQRGELGVRGGGIGAVAGGVLGPVVGPRVPTVGLGAPGATVGEALERTVGAEARLPAGVLSDSRMVHGLTQATRAAPFVGTRIDDRIHNVIDQVQQRVAHEAQTLAGGITDRAAAGAVTRPAIENLVELNNKATDRAYSVLRQSMDTTKTMVPRNTMNELNSIIRQRGWMDKPESGLADFVSLVNGPRTFEDLLRARHMVGEMGSWKNPNPGIAGGDIKMLYKALSQDLEDIVRATAHNQQGNFSLRLWRNANDAASQFIKQNQVLGKLLSIKSDEGLVGAIKNAASAKSGNVSLLAQMKNGLQPDEWDNIAGLVLHEMGQNQAGEFSTNFFFKNWNAMPDRVKNLLFSDPSTRRLVDDVGIISERLKKFSLLSNTSNTARTAATLSALGFGVYLGNVDPMEHLGKVMGGTAVALALSRPQTAAGAARWARAYENLVRNPTRFTAQAFQRMSGELSNQINKSLGSNFTADELAGRDRGNK